MDKEVWKDIKNYEGLYQVSNYGNVRSFDRIRKQLFGIENSRAKKIYQYDLNNVFIREFDYIKQASEELNINSSSISAVCKRKRKTAGGYIWKYERR